MIRTIAAILILGVFLVVSIAPTYANPSSPQPVGRVIWIKGLFKATTPNKEVRTLQKASIIYLNDTLETDANSQAQIAFTDNSLMTFRPSTIFYIDQYDLQSSSSSGGVTKTAGKYIMNLIQGGFRTITGLIAKNSPDNYRVNTPVATIGVRGTDYTIAYENGQLYVGHYAGIPCVTSGAGTLCLSQTIKYANVPSKGAMPIQLKVQPTVFKEQLKITPAKVAPFTGPGSTPPKGGAGTPTGTGTTGSGTTSSGTTTPGTTTPGTTGTGTVDTGTSPTTPTNSSPTGVVSSFCISWLKIIKVPC